MLKGDVLERHVATLFFGPRNNSSSVQIEPVCYSETQAGFIATAARTSNRLSVFFINSVESKLCQQHADIEPMRHANPERGHFEATGRYSTLERDGPWQT
jgi:hypothetical protein